MFLINKDKNRVQQSYNMGLASCLLS